MTVLIRLLEVVQATNCFLAGGPGIKTTYVSRSVPSEAQAWIENVPKAQNREFQGKVRYGRRSAGEVPGTLEIVFEIVLSLFGREFRPHERL